MSAQTDPRTDATIRKYLKSKVQEKFGEDYALLEHIIDELVVKYSLKELYMVCNVEISRIKNSSKRVWDSRSPRDPF